MTAVQHGSHFCSLQNCILNNRITQRWSLLSLLFWFPACVNEYASILLRSKNIRALSWILFLEDAAWTQFRFWFIGYNYYYQNWQVPLRHTFFNLVTGLLVSAASIIWQDTGHSCKNNLSSSETPYVNPASFNLKRCLERRTPFGPQPDEQFLLVTTVVHHVLKSPLMISDWWMWRTDTPLVPVSLEWPDWLGDGWKS